MLVYRGCWSDPVLKRIHYTTRCLWRYPSRLSSHQAACGPCHRPEMSSSSCIDQQTHLSLEYFITQAAQSEGLTICWWTSFYLTAGAQQRALKCSKYIVFQYIGVALSKQLEVLQPATDVFFDATFTVVLTLVTRLTALFHTSTQHSLFFRNILSRNTLAPCTMLLCFLFSSVQMHNKFK